MNHTRVARVLPAASVVLASIALTLTACSGPGSGPATRGAFVLDGEVSEWRDDAVATADDRFVYIRFAMEGEPATLQANVETTRIAIDTDNNPETGNRLSGGELGTLGIDLEILLSPHVESLPPEAVERLRNWHRGDDPLPRVTGGVAVRRFDAQGRARAVSHADIDFALAPTYANPWFEARIGRLSSALIGSGIDAEGTARAAILLEDANREIVGYSDPVEIRLPRAAKDLGLATDRVPAQQPGTIRVLSFNVLKAKPAREPEPFARLITALAPDVILFQEFDGLDADELADWLNEHVGKLDQKYTLRGDPTAEDRRDWYAVADADRGVAIASVHRIAYPFAAPVTIGEDDEASVVRSITALLDTPQGEILATSVHLKCCGTADSSEDRERLLEAEAINAAILQHAQEASAITGRWPAIRVVGGDINLVGSRDPLDVLGAGLDSDGSELTPANAQVLGDRAYYTWSDPESQFSPGRLDWVLYSDASARVERGFVLDLGRLTRESVAAAGLRPSDTAASDHLPLVVDIRPLK